MIRVLVADEHRLVVEGLCALLQCEAEIEVVGITAGGCAASETALLRPNVVVLGAIAPDHGGMNTIQQIRQACPDTQVVVLLNFSSHSLVSGVVEAGALACVTTSEPFQRTVLAIRAAAECRRFLSTRLANQTQANDSPPDESASALQPQPSVLSPREKEVLQLVAEGLSSKQIGVRLHVTSKTVEWHRRSIMEKLHIYSVAGLTKYAIREGLTPLESV